MGGMEGSRCLSNTLPKIKTELLIKFYNGDLSSLEWRSVNTTFYTSTTGVYIYAFFWHMLTINSAIIG